LVLISLANSISTLRGSSIPARRALRSSIRRRVARAGCFSSITEPDSNRERRRRWSRGISRGGRSLESTTWPPFSRTAMKSAKNSSCTWFLPASEWTSSTSSRVNEERRFRTRAMERFRTASVSSSINRSLGA